MAKPKLLLDENIGHVPADVLTARGYDVATIAQGDAGLRDEFVLEKSLRDNRILITLDKDFGRLVYQQSKRHVGVIFLRMKKESAENIKNTILKVLENFGKSFPGKFITASESRIRIR